MMREYTVEFSNGRTLRVMAWSIDEARRRAYMLDRSGVIARVSF